MYRAALRSAPRIASPLRRLCAAPSGRRFASTSSAGPKRGWKSSTVRWALATGAVYYYSTSAVFAEEPQLENIRPPPEFSDEDLPTVEAVIAQKRREAEARLQKAASASPKSETATFASQTSAETPVKEIDANGQGLVDIDGTEQRSPEEGSPEALEEEAAQQGAFNPVTGEINWECPCLGGMAHGPCGDEFKAAFSCFVYSQEEPKGMDCIDKFQHMQDCFRLHPEVYSEELADGDDATTDGATEGAASGVVSARDGSAEGVSEDHAVAESSSDKDVAKLDVKKIETETKPEDEENAATVPPPEEKNPTRNSTTADCVRKQTLSSSLSRAFVASLIGIVNASLKSKKMSYADVAASGPRQTPQEAAAPQPPQVVPTEAVTNASLVDVDVPTIRTVPPDFVEQDVQTGTQKKRKEREQQEEQARAEADFAKKKKKKKKSANGARTSKNVLAKFFGNMSKDTTNPIFLANVTAVVGVGTYLGYKAVGLYQRGQLTRKTIGIGAGVVAGMGLVQIMLGKYLYNGGKGGKEREKS